MIIINEKLWYLLCHSAVNLQVIFVKFGNDFIQLCYEEIS